MERRRIWVFPSFEATRIACNVTASVKVAYHATLRRMKKLCIEHDCAITTGVLDGQSVLIFCWEPGVDERLPAIVDAIALLTGGTEKHS